MNQSEYCCKGVIILFSWLMIPRNVLPTHSPTVKTCWWKMRTCISLRFNVETRKRLNIIVISTFNRTYLRYMIAVEVTLWTLHRAIKYCSFLSLPDFTFLRKQRRPCQTIKLSRTSVVVRVPVALASACNGMIIFMKHGDKIMVNNKVVSVSE